MNIHLIRGAFANQFELQNYEPLIDRFNLQLIASKHPITTTKIPTINLWSPYDLPNFPYKKALLNRLIGDPHWLWNLSSAISSKNLDESIHLSRDDSIDEIDQLMNQTKLKTPQKTIVHVAETYYAYTHQAVELKKKRRIDKLISTCWETIPFNNETLLRKKKWKKEARRYIDHFITPTHKAKEALAEEGVDRGKITVIKMGVDIDRFQPKSTKNKVFTILFVGRVVEEKGIVDLLQAISSIKNIKLKIVGTGKLNLSNSKNITKKNVAYSKIHHEYQKTDLFVLPSRSTKTWEEQYGMALVEAMASGLPIITTNTGATREVVGNSAIFIKENSPKQLEKKIRKLIKNPSKRKDLSQKARARAIKYFDKNKVANKLANLYNKL